MCYVSFALIVSANSFAKSVLNILSIAVILDSAASISNCSGLFSLCLFVFLWEWYEILAVTKSQNGDERMDDYLFFDTFYG